MQPNEIRQWRATHKFTPVELADALGVARNTVYRWESGAMEPIGNLAERLELLLAQREAARTAQPPTTLDPRVFVVESYQPYGTVMGLKRSFWLDMTDQDRVDWINTFDNPLLALPWPWWSHGYDFYPGGKIIGHYLLRDYANTLASRLKDARGDTAMEKLRNVIIQITRTDFPTWLKPVRGFALDADAYATLCAAMDKAQKRAEKEQDRETSIL